MAIQIVNRETSPRIIFKLDPASIPELNITVGPDLTSHLAHLDINSHLAIAPISQQKHPEAHLISVTVLKPIPREQIQLEEVESAFLHIPATQYGNLIKLLAQTEEKITHNDEFTDTKHLVTSIEAILYYGSIVGPAALVN